MGIFKRCNSCHELYQGKYCPSCRPKQQKASQRSKLDNNKNTRVYHSRLWEKCRRNVIVRDMGYDIWLLGIGQVYKCQRPHVHHIKERDEAQEMAAKVTEALTGAGIWGVEFFLSNENGVYFSELSPRPHDTGMVTLAGTQCLNEFELHARAVLGLPIPEIEQYRMGASAVILSPIASQEQPRYRGIEEAVAEPDTDIRIFGKPYTKVNRRMGVVVCNAPNGSDMDALRDKCKAAAAKVEVY